MSVPLEVERMAKGNKCLTDASSLAEQRLSLSFPLSLLSPSAHTPTHHHSTHPHSTRLVMRHLKVVSVSLEKKTRDEEIGDAKYLAGVRVYV